MGTIKESVQCGIDSTIAYLNKHYPHIFKEQKHVKDPNPSQEEAYYLYGRASAMLDALRSGHISDGDCPDNPLEHYLDNICNHSHHQDL
jgi:hypothetical protein